VPCPATGQGRMQGRAGLPCPVDISDLVQGHLRKDILDCYPSGSYNSMNTFLSTTKFLRFKQTVEKSDLCFSKNHPHLFPVF
jgi:hypothetical protein